MSLRIRQTENVTQFAKRLSTIYNQIEGASNEVAVKSFQQALLPGNELRKDLVQFPVVTMKALIARANQFIETEEDEVRAQESFGLYQEEKPSKKDKRSSQREEVDRNRVSSTSAMASVPISRVARNLSQNYLLQGCKHDLQRADLQAPQQDQVTTLLQVAAANEG